jgi:mannose-6-phosphate isomerase
MGTHPSGPAMLAADPTTSLQDWLEQHSQALGPTVLKRFGLKLPFLFKVSAWIAIHQMLLCHVLADGVSAAEHAVLITVFVVLQVLSVETALSIQSHPDKELAERLHAQHPEVSQLSCYLPLHLPVRPKMLISVMQDAFLHRALFRWLLVC